MEKRSGFLMKDQELTLLGHEVKVGEKAPDFSVVKGDLSPLSLKDLGDKVKLIIAVPSLDTSVCQLETIRFNEEAEKLGEEVVVLTVSMDLPFAQGRFCSSNNIKNAIVTSDYQTRSFAENYGVLMDGLFLTNRSVFVLDRDNTVRYVEYVKQNTDHPDYDKALNAARELLK